MREICQYITPRELAPPREWVESNIVLKGELSAVSARKNQTVDLDFTPYLIEPLEYCCLNDNNSECTLMAAERMGKSSVAFWSRLYRGEFNPDSVRVGMIVYKSDDFARDINQTKFEPLMNCIDTFKRELEKPHSKRSDHYNLLGQKLYFQGSGTDIIGLDVPWRYADEIDFWQTHENKVNNLINLRKRGFTFDYGIFIKSSSPTTQSGPVYKEFKKGSQGYYTLFCTHCGRHTLRSCDIHNLQWEYEEDEIVETSMRLVCPECKHEHKEDNKREMIIKGKYIHLHPERYERHASFQMGTLASQMPKHRWIDIAIAQDEAGKRANVENQKLLDNSYKGLPFKTRKATAGQITTIKEHRWDELTAPNPEKIENIFMSVDTQDDGFYSIVRSIDSSENMHLLDYQKVKTFEELDEIWTKEYYGIEPIMCIHDEGGHKTKEVKAFAKERPGYYTYKGNPRIGMRWKRFEDKKCIHAIPNQFQSDLLYYIYSQTKRDNNYWFIPPDVSDIYIDQMSSVRNTKRVKNADEYENWEAVGDDHFFDCEKQWLVLLEFARQTLSSQHWKQGKGSWIEQGQELIINNNSSKSSWVNKWR